MHTVTNTGPHTYEILVSGAPWERLMHHVEEMLAPFTQRLVRWHDAILALEVTRYYARARIRELPAANRGSRLRALAKELDAIVDELAAELNKEGPPPSRTVGNAAADGEKIALGAEKPCTQCNTGVD